MNGILIYPAGSTAALRHAGRSLIDRGISVTAAPAPDVTHLLLPVPSFESDGRVRGGGVLEHILSELPEDVTVIGGRLDHPALHGYRTIDLLQDSEYLARNAAITADCAVRIAAANLNTVFEGCPMLIIGWGRIGKCLGKLLKAMGADVSVSARRESDRAMLGALGFRAEDTLALNPSLIRYRVIFNTVPAPVLTDAQIRHCRPDCIKIELASTDGIAGPGVIRARGLPGKDTPEASGELIAKSIIRILAEGRNRK